VSSLVPSGIVCMLSIMFEVNMIRGGPNLGMLAYGYKYYLTVWVVRGELFAVPEAQ